MWCQQVFYYRYLFVYECVAKYYCRRSVKYTMEFGDGAYRRFDMGLAFGAGIGLEMGPGIISLDLRYDLGFVNIKNGPKAEDSKASCNRAFTIGLEYMIPLY
jgi:hypothetical protein